MGSVSSASHYWLAEPVDPAETIVGTPIVVARYASGEGFLDAYRDVEPAGALVVPTRARPADGSEVVLEIFWPELPNPVFVRALVGRRRNWLVARLHGDAQAARDFLVQMAAGERTRFYRRKQRRWCVRLSTHWRRFGDLVACDGVVEDLSTGGALIATWSAPPKMGERVALRIAAPGVGQDLIVTGTVRHTEPRTGDAAFGLQFDYRSSGEQRRLRRLVRVFAARGIVIL